MPLRLFKKCGSRNSKKMKQTNDSSSVIVSATAEMEAADLSFPESCSSHQLLQSPEPDDSMELISMLLQTSRYIEQCIVG